MTEPSEKGSRKKRIGWFIIANSIVWGVVIIATSLVLGGTGYMGKLIPILGGGAAFSVVVLSSILTGEK